MRRLADRDSKVSKANPAGRASSSGACAAADVQDFLAASPLVPAMASETPEVGRAAAGSNPSNASLRVLPDGREYKQDSIGRIWVASQSTELGRLTGPFAACRNWSIVCRMHRVAGRRCGVIKTARQLHEDPVHLIAWLLDGQGLPENAIDAHKKLWKPPPQQPT